MMKIREMGNGGWQGVDPGHEDRKVGGGSDGDAKVDDGRLRRVLSRISRLLLKKWMDYVDCCQSRRVMGYGAWMKHGVRARLRLCLYRFGVMQCQSFLPLAMAAFWIMSDV